MFLPPGVNDISSWMDWLQIVADPDNYKKKIQELVEISTTSQKNFEESKQALIELERKTRNFKKEEEEFRNWSDKERKKTQDILDDLYVRVANVSKREEEHLAKAKELEDNYIRKTQELNSREGSIAVKEREIDIKLENINSLKSELESKVTRLRSIKDLIE
jgi:hypothetical protein